MAIYQSTPQRYLVLLSSLDDTSAGERDLQRLSQSRVSTSPSVKGLNFFSPGDQALLRTLQRLRTLGLIKKVTHTYRYALTRLGHAAIAAACSLTRFSIVPAMAATR